MNKSTIIDRTVVCIFDIEGYSKKEPKDQVAALRNFFESLDKHLDELNDICPDAYSTGDGAIVSIGRRCRLDGDDCLKFLKFIIDFVHQMHTSGLVLRTAANYSELNKVINIKALRHVQGSYIQSGDSINTASRMMDFCEPREILISDSFVDFMKRRGVFDSSLFLKNDPLTTKHEEVLKTYSYKPPKEDTLLYSPFSGTHKYKKFSYFPPLGGDVVRFFMQTGLEFELQKIVSQAFDSIKNINVTRNVLSWNNIVNVLTQLKYDPDDQVYVISRHDKESNFWTQRNKSMYINYLKTRCQSRGVINQTRVRVYNEVMEMAGDDIHHDLIKLHGPNSYYSIASDDLVKCPKLNALIFGVTISKKYKYAIIATPAPESMDTTFPDLENIELTLERYKEYDSAHGPMKAIISANENYVSQLIQEFEDLLKHPALYDIKENRFVNANR
jgi:hypothetical protein